MTHLQDTLLDVGAQGVTLPIESSPPTVTSAADERREWRASMNYEGPVVKLNLAIFVEKNSRTSLLFLTHANPQLIPFRMTRSREPLLRRGPCGSFLVRRK